VFQQLVAVYNYNAASRSNRHDAWMSIEGLAAYHWEQFAQLVLDTRSPLPKIPGNHVVRTVRRLVPTLPQSERIAVIRLLHAVSERASRVIMRPEDRVACRSAARSILNESEASWTGEQRIEATRIVESFSGA
jgi:hypothetical protein